MIYKDELTLLTNSIGSTYFLQKYVSSENKINLANVILSTSQDTSIINFYVQPKAAESEWSNYLNFNEIDGQIINIHGDKGVLKRNIDCSVINREESTLPTLNFISNVAAFSCENKAYLAVRKGTIRKLMIYKVNPDGSCTLIPFVNDEDFDNYRISHFYYNEEEGTIEFDYEKENWTQANANNKVRGCVTACVSDSVNILTKRYYNPAVEFYLKELSEPIRLQSLLTSHVQTHNQEITDRALITNLQNHCCLNCVYTKCDFAFEDTFPELSPRISIVQISLSSDPLSNIKQNYVFLISRGKNSEFAFLKGYKVNKRNKLIPITKTKL